MRRLLGAALALALAACGSSDTTVVSTNLDRPTALAFACASSPLDGGVPSVLPLSQCADLASTLPSTPGVSTLYGFALDSVRGEIATFRGDGTLLDEEPRTPGFSFIPVGALAEDLKASSDGQALFVTVGSACELVRIPVTAALRIGAAANGDDVAHIPFMAGGAALRARPSQLALVAEDACRAAGAASGRCGYVSFPGCGAIALTALDTGQILKSFMLSGAGIVDVGQSPTCQADCSTGPPTEGQGSDGGVVDPGAGIAPTSLTVVNLGTVTRLYVGLRNDGAVWAIDLGADGTPQLATATRIELEGARGVLTMRASGPIGALGTTARFLYVVARDGTVHVVRIDEDVPVECDTQTDPRVLAGAETSEARICTPAALHLRRRPGDLGPGIRLPGGELPRDVQFASIDNFQRDLPDADLAAALGLLRDHVPWSPFRLNGDFAFIAGARGRVYVVTLADRDAVFLHPDDISATRAHQLRSGTIGQFDTETLPGFRSQGVVRADAILRVDETGADLSSDIGPALRTVPVSDSTGVISFVPHPAQRIPAGVGPTVQDIDAERNSTFPDLQMTSSSDRWNFELEGSLMGGAPRFSGEVRSIDAQTAALEDSTAPFCQIGAQPGDTLVLRGCDQPTDCGPGTFCEHNATAPTQAGLCFPGTEEQRHQLDSRCADLLVVGRQYSVLDVTAGRMVIAPRLKLHPDGILCNQDKDPVCTPVRDPLTGLDAPFTCEPAPGSGGLRRCAQSCQALGECGDGFTCDLDRGLCVAGPVPRPECFVGLQRYELRVADALYASRSGTTTPHRIIADPAQNGKCVADPTQSPLLANRVPRSAPACGPGVDGPCSTMVNGVSVIRYQNSALSFDFTGMQGEIPTGFRMSVDIGGGFLANTVDLDSPLPYAIEMGPDGLIYVVQSGANTATGGQGVVERFQPLNVSLDKSFTVR